MVTEPSGDPAFPVDAVEVGFVVGAWGVKGWVRVRPYSSDPQALFSSRRWFLAEAASAGAGVVPRGGRAEGAGLPNVLRETDARAHGGDVVAAVREVSDRDAAQTLKGARVFVSRASFPTPQDDEFYWVDLIGLTVVNRQGVVLGTVDGLLETGANAVMRVREAQPVEAVSSPRERLLPFVAAHVDRVDLAGRQILVDWDADF